MLEFKNLHELITRLPDEKACRKYFEQHRWENGRSLCPNCGSLKNYRLEAEKRFKCGNSACYKKFSVLTGTVFEASNVPLQKWFMAIYIMTAHKKGISSLQLGRDIGVTQKTAWFMLMRIREMGRPKQPIILKDHVQADEAYIGGIEKNKHLDKRSKTPEEASLKKTPVIGIIEKGGKVVTKVTPWVTKVAATDLILEHVQKGAILVTDTASIYFKVGKKYDHQKINHSEGQFKSNGFHTNGIENYWSLFQRGILGIYHQVSPKHLQRYCDEFSYRFNSRKIKDADRFVASLKNTEGTLKYKDLITNSLTSWEHGKEIDETPEE